MRKREAEIYREMETDIHIYRERVREGERKRGRCNDRESDKDRMKGHRQRAIQTEHGKEN